MDSQVSIPRLGETMLPLDNALWRFSLAVYAVPGVADDCLELQRMADMDVNLLLFCVWLGAMQSRRIDDAEAHALIAMTAPWREIVIEPIRAVRMQLRGAWASPDAETAARRCVLALELHAEQHEQAMLFAIAPRIGALEPTCDRAVLCRLDIATLLRCYRVSHFPTTRLIKAAISVAACTPASA